jgi:hypothetical protein
MKLGIRLHNRRGSAFFASSLLFSLVAGAGCSFIPGIDKLEDASMAEHARFASTALGVDAFGSLTRSSGEILHFRLTTLFPAASINRADFLPSTADGLNRALAQAERPTSSLAQIALRSKTLAYCRGDVAGTGAGALFSESGIWLRGESAPASASRRAAVAAARNAWLYPYAADSAEVGELASLYETVAADAGDAEARRAVCIAVTSAPQFAIGNPKKGDAVRRVYLEVGRTLPPMQDVADFEAGRTTLGAIVGKIQTQASLKDGYLESVRSWHREWLGLRPFLWGDQNYEPRPYNGAASRTYAHVLGADIANVADAGGKKVVGISNDGGFQVQNCQPGTAGAANVQPFDPRTTMAVWEFRNPVQNRWEVFGGYVHPDRLEDYLALIRAYAGAEADVVRGECVRMDTVDPRHAVAGFPDYYRCPGRVGGAGGGFVSASLEELSSANIANGNIANTLTFVSSRLREQSVLSSFQPSARFDKKDMRVRRFSPSGEQNGVSLVKLWYSGEEVYACNALERYMMTCAYRPPSFDEGGDGWGWIADYGWGAANSWVKYGTYVRADSLVNPRILNQMKCGMPSQSELSRLDGPPSEPLAFPQGYELAPASYLSATPPPASSLNAVAMNVNNRGAGVAELEAIHRLRESLDEEPYRLVEQIIDSNAPYSDIVSAKYTVGTSELELYYRSLGQHLPTYPSGAGPSAAAGEPHVFRLDSLPSVSSNFVSPPRGAGTRPLALRPKPAAGILTMPAFLSPVASKMRTISSRYFTRLLCGEANVFQPDPGQALVHERYMVDSANQTASASAKAHLDHRQICYGCHVNMDPLAQALSPNFLRYVQENEYAALTGEMRYSQITNQNNGILGTVWGTEIGHGALLGQEVSGVEQVGQVIGRSDLFAKCIVRRTFENVVGRQIAVSDETEFNRWVADFKRNGLNYNRLIRTIVDSPIYSGGN